MPRNPNRERDCRQCGQRFALKRSGERYCSPRCRRIGYKRRTGLLVTTFGKPEPIHADFRALRQDRIAMLAALAAHGLPLDLPPEVGMQAVARQPQTNTTVPSSCSMR